MSGDSTWELVRSKERVVVVGNSPTILKYGNGRMINSFDKVIRINACKTYGFTKHVGSKTNVWVTSATKHKFTQKFGKLFLPNQILDKEVWFRTAHTESDYRDFITTKFGTIKSTILVHKKGQEPSKYGTESLNLKKFYGRCFPTTGVLAILRALQLYKKITLVGHTFYRENSADHNHTYDGQILNENLAQYGQCTKEVLKEFYEDGRIEFPIKEEEQIFKSL